MDSTLKRLNRAIKTLEKLEVDLSNFSVNEDSEAFFKRGEAALYRSRADIQAFKDNLKLIKSYPEEQSFKIKFVNTSEKFVNCRGIFEGLKKQVKSKELKGVGGINFDEIDLKTDGSAGGHQLRVLDADEHRNVEIKGETTVSDNVLRQMVRQRYSKDKCILYAIIGLGSLILLGVVLGLLIPYF